MYKAVLDTQDSYGPFYKEFIDSSKYKALLKMEEYLKCTTGCPSMYMEQVKIEKV
jgi:hypothetical protein